MSRVALFLLVLFPVCSALAHSGHDAPEPHLHAIWEVCIARRGHWCVGDDLHQARVVTAPRAKARPNSPVT